MRFQARGDLTGSRLHDIYLPGMPFTKCEARLDCVDCHTRREIMGDGLLYDNQRQAEYVQCKTCHGTLTEPPLTATITRPDELVLRLAALNPVAHLQVGDTVIVTDRGEPLWNTRRLPDGSFELIGKATAQHFRLPLVMGSACRQKPDEQGAEACHACHTFQP
jgi:hypothetical protein